MGCSGLAVGVWGLGLGVTWVSVEVTIRLSCVQEYAIEIHQTSFIGPMIYKGFRPLY